MFTHDTFTFSNKHLDELHIYVTGPFRYSM